MKKFKILIILGFLFLFSVNHSEAQFYNTGVGARIGSYTGIGVKHFLSDQNAIEGMLTFPWNNIFLAHVLYEFQKPFKGTDYFSWYIGGGGHIGGDHGTTIIGLDFIIGVEYTFKEAPFCIGIDWKPEVNFVGDQNWWGDKVALTVKYVFR